VDVRHTIGDCLSDLLFGTTSWFRHFALTWLKDHFLIARRGPLRVRALVLVR
jgi:hypothetical protein